MINVLLYEKIKCSTNERKKRSKFCKTYYTYRKFRNDTHEMFYDDYDSFIEENKADKEKILWLSTHEGLLFKLKQNGITGELSDVLMFCLIF